VDNAVGGAMMQVAGSAPMAGPMGPPVAPGGFGPIGQTRGAVMQLVISAICGFYALYLIWVEVTELKAFRQKDDINPILFFIPILNLIQLWGLNAKVLEAKQMAGVPNPQVSHSILYLFLWPYFMTNDLNEIWAAARGGGGGGPQY
jgi:hypothetical protein